MKVARPLGRAVALEKLYTQVAVVGTFIGPVGLEAYRFIALRPERWCHIFAHREEMNV